MRPQDWAWLVLWIALALGARWYFMGEPPWPDPAQDTAVVVAAHTERSTT